jgi:hypothetical protein
VAVRLAAGQLDMAEFYCRSRLRSPARRPGPR